MRNPIGVAYTALIVIESIWWFSVLAAIGAYLGFGGSPILWVNLLVLMGVGVISAWVFGGAKGDVAIIALYQGVVALLVVYCTVASTSIGDDWSFKIAWPIDMFGGTYDGESVGELITALVVSSLIWYRAQNLAAGDGVRRRLSRAFRLGTMFMAIALMVEVNVGFSIGIKQLLLPFFGASLIGLAASRLPQSDDTGNAPWPFVVAVSVFSILGIGLIGGVLTGWYGNLGVRGLVIAWGAFVDSLIWILKWPIELAMRGLWALILWLQNVFGGEEIVEDRVGQTRPLQPVVDDKTEQVERLTHVAIDAVRWPLSILLVAFVFFILVLAFRRYVRRRGETDQSRRESIRDGAVATADMMKLLSGLLPDWMRPGKGGSLWKWPESEKGVGEVFLLYFDTLAHAIKRGMEFDPNLTPSERIPQLANYLPGAPVDTLTNRFNEACYGGQPTDLDELSRLRQAVDEAATQPLTEV